MKVFLRMEKETFCVVAAVLAFVAFEFFSYNDCGEQNSTFCSNQVLKEIFSKQKNIWANYGGGGWGRMGGSVTSNVALQTRGSGFNSF